MKKLVIIIIVLLLLVGAGGGAYYYFFMMNDNSELIEPEGDSSVAEEIAIEQKIAVEVNMNYFVDTNKLNVRSYPQKSAPIRSVLRKGKPLKALEIKGDWVRISEYEVHQSGNDVADWIHSDFISHDKPVITDREIRKNMQKLLNKSDDFITYSDQFVIATRKLLEDETCSYEDFELMDGWVLSRTFNIEPVYFVYCGGTQRENKIYVNVETGEIFQP
ncbi:SH3 domain-containing protein [Vibrio algarum]|uniref:SH3 domain-containing protein n=1 Tax=Vibrio algarum TaxID=3020714 RepID=A0ABT4YX36_9VIBR|nr:SH3 domain-containing protein [Vibrio sp. KJ40-1]MDB1126063.1 SH3 domain-containing protein [Vibrio sp. KJ40-1]